MKEGQARKSERERRRRKEWTKWLSEWNESGREQTRWDPTWFLNAGQFVPVSLHLVWMKKLASVTLAINLQILSQITSALMKVPCVMKIRRVYTKTKSRTQYWDIMLFPLISIQSSTPLQTIVWINTVPNALSGFEGLTMTFGLFRVNLCHETPGMQPDHRK